jgi:hypothetical protein
MPVGATVSGGSSRNSAFMPSRESIKGSMHFDMGKRGSCRAATLARQTLNVLELSSYALDS